MLLNSSKSRKNLIFSACSEIIIFALSFFVPRMLVLAYGSETNGLLNSTNQILQYLTIFEAGIGSVMLKELYGPLVNKDKDKVQDIYYSGRAYYRKITLWYFFALVCISLIYCFTINSTIPSNKVFLVVLLSGLSNVLVFYFVSAKSFLIKADGNYYFIAIVNMIIRCLNYIVQIIAAYLKADIVIIKAAGLGVTILNILIFYIFFKKKYHFDKKRKEQIIKIDIFKDRKYYFIHQVAGLMFSCTDTVLLTFICGFSIVSVYSIYNLVIMGISSVLTIVIESLTYILGQTYNKSLKAYYFIHDSFKMLYMMIAFVLGSCAVVLYVPFVELYVGNSDITYADKYLAVLFPLILVLNSTRRIDNLLSSFSGHAKQTLNQVLIELGINVALSFTLVFFIGIYGVLIGTTVAIFYRFISSIRYNEEAILFRPKMCGYKYGMIDLIIFAVVAVLSALIKIQAANFFSFILYGIISFIVMSVVYLGVNYLFIKEDFMNMLKFTMDIFTNKVHD